jgi:hypothetical protein
MKLPHEVERLGPDVQSWVEQQLISDLRHYCVQLDDLRIDWSQVVQEGHWTDFRGRMLESLSEVVVRGSDGSIVAEGWMDFVFTSDATDSEPKLFWLFLSVAAGRNDRETNCRRLLGALDGDRVHHAGNPRRASLNCNLAASLAPAARAGG